MDLRKKYHKYTNNGIVVIPYGKSKFLQFFYIYNLLNYFRSAYKWKSHIEIKKFNCEWIDKVRFKVKIKKNWDKQTKKYREKL